MYSPSISLILCSLPSSIGRAMMMSQRFCVDIDLSRRVECVFPSSLITMTYFAGYWSRVSLTLEPFNMWGYKARASTSTEVPWLLQADWVNLNAGKTCTCSWGPHIATECNAEYWTYHCLLKVKLWPANNDHLLLLLAKSRVPPPRKKI